MNLEPQMKSKLSGDNGWIGPQILKTITIHGYW